MEAMKWLGSLAAALVVVSVVIGLVLAAGSIVAIVATLAIIIGMIFLIAKLLKSFWEEVL